MNIANWYKIFPDVFKSEFRYSKDIVYNKFQWPDTTYEQKTEIESLAQAVLNTRTLYPDSCIAGLYVPITMPPELLKAHQTIDRAVMKIYGFPERTTESTCVVALMERYGKISGEKRDD